MGKLVPAMPQEPIDCSGYDDPDDYCPNCGGEGWVSGCFEMWACVDPEGGCEECMIRCDWCNERPAGRRALQENGDA